MSSLDIQGLSKRYGATSVLDQITLSVPSGSRTAIVGPSGSGKTTLLRLIAGYDAPDTGEITLDGQPLAEAGKAMPAHLRNIGVVPQDGALFPHLTIGENIGFGLPRAMAGRADRVAELATMVGLKTEMLPRKPDQLSGGQQQRVALARALALQPRLMLLDEPFSALDTGLRASTRKTVAGLLEQAGITTILVTHDQSEALSFADQVAVMRAGRLVQVGSPRELYHRPQNAMVAEFLGDTILLPGDAADGWATCALGRVPLADRQRQGRVELMFRPEQVTLSALPAEGAIPAQIAEIDFGGGICTLTLGLADGTRLSLRTTSSSTSEGGTVYLGVSDPVHAF